ncbi:hypothetical protein PBY51_003400 [Eleginops maclovinus]|uniref:Uncharacterized protein n=1 Tax=Eleginops maclovinus TaxID=56733 RepID=A0AAN7Y102_ELEMC|nr:hypothetical protein PBY51_003400 [Eleginops maclovinus]
MDSVSVVTRSSRTSIVRSKASSASMASSARLREEAKRAALEAKAASLKQSPAEKKELRINTALAVSNAIYEEYDAQDKSDAMNMHLDNASTQHSLGKKENTQEQAGPSTDPTL